jgi:hypothetical protein
MGKNRSVLYLIGLLLGFAFLCEAQEYQLQYFLTRSPSKGDDLSTQEKKEILSGIGETLERIQRSHHRLTSAVLSGEMELRYQEGKLWMAKAEEDLKSIETGLQQLKLLKEKPGDLVAALVLYKSLKDLALNLSAFNNEPSFAVFVGDQAPELMLWTDPVFYQFYLLPLAQSRNAEKKVDEKLPKQEKKPPVKGK